MEIQLQGGVANAGSVVRSGDHVLRPSNPHTPTIHRFLGSLVRTGFDGASQPVGVDTDGRERLRFIDGGARPVCVLLRRVEEGDENFIEMWNSMGGMKRFDVRRAWWARTRPQFDAAMR